MNVMRKDNFTISHVTRYAQGASQTRPQRIIIEGEYTMVYLEISLNIAGKDRDAAAGVYTKYKAPFLTQVTGAKSKELLIRDEDVQVLHGFDTASNAKAYLVSELFKNDVVGELRPLLQSAPDVRIYETA